MARSYLGRDERGLLGFDLGDGGPPAWLPPTPDTTAAALRMTAAAGGDPAAVLLGASLPPRRGAMSPDALAAAPGIKVGLGGMIDLSPAAPAAPPAAGPGIKVGLGNQIDLGPAPAAPPAGGAGLPALTPQQIARGFSGKGKAEPLPLTPQSGGTDLRVLTAQNDAAAAATPAGPPQLVPTPAQAGPAAPTAADPYANLNPEERKKLELDRIRLQFEASKRPSGGQLLKGGKQQTAEGWQGELGPDPETLAAMRANAAATAKNQGLQAQANAERDAKIGDVQQNQADYEQEHARIQAEIAQRKQDALAGLGQQSRELQQKIASAEIDPTRWYANRSTGDKIMMGVAIALDGVVKGLTGRGLGQPNPILGEMYRLQNQDIDAQIKNIDKQRGDLNDLQRVYVQTKEQFGDEALAADATKLAGLAAFRAQIQQAAAQADAARGTEPTRDPADVALAGEMEAAFREALGGDTPMAQQAAELRLKKLASQTRSYSLKARALELDVERQALDKQAALEARMNGALSKQFGFTQDRYVGGSAGANLDKMSEIQGKNAAMLRGADNDAAKGGKDKTPALFIDGKPFAVGTGASQVSIDKAQTRISFADDVLTTVDTALADKRIGRAAPGDPVRKGDALGLANGLAQMAGGGVASESDKADASAILDPKDPRHEDALQRTKQRAINAKINAAKSVGTRFLWPTKPPPLVSRCTARTRAKRCRSTLDRPASCSAPGKPPSPPTRTCPCWAPTAGCRSSRAPRPAPSSGRSKG